MQVAFIFFGLALSFLVAIFSYYDFLYCNSRRKKRNNGTRLQVQPHISDFLCSVFFVFHSVLVDDLFLELKVKRIYSHLSSNTLIIYLIKP